MPPAAVLRKERVRCALAKQFNQTDEHPWPWQQSECPVYAGRFYIKLSGSGSCFNAGWLRIVWIRLAFWRGMAAKCPAPVGVLAWDDCKMSGSGWHLTRDGCEMSGSGWRFCAGRLPSGRSGVRREWVGDAPKGRRCPATANFRRRFRRFPPSPRPAAGSARRCRGRTVRGRRNFRGLPGFAGSAGGRLRWRNLWACRDARNLV